MRKLFHSILFFFLNWKFHNLCNSTTLVPLSFLLFSFHFFLPPALIMGTSFIYVFILLLFKL